MALIDERAGRDVTVADAPTPASTRTKLLVLAATALSFVLGLLQLGSDSFWVDDGFTDRKSVV